MTAQISDKILFEDSTYSLIAIENEWPFKPNEYGFNPIMMSTACWRGYYCKYDILDGNVFLNELTISLEDKPPTWRGITAKRTDIFGEAAVYTNVNLKIDYSGGIIIGRDFIREFYVHMGFHRPHCYKFVYELVFDNGKLSKISDRSENMKRIRDNIRGNRTTKSTNTIHEIEEFIRRSFSLSFGDKWREKI